MPERWKDHKLIISKGGAWALVGGVCFFLGIAFAVLGVIGDAVDSTLGLEPISWFLLAIAVLVISAIWYFSWGVAVYVDAIEAKSKKEK